MTVFKINMVKRYSEDFLLLLVTFSKPAVRRTHSQHQSQIYVRRYLNGQSVSRGTTYSNCQMFIGLFQGHFKMSNLTPT